VTGTIYLIPVTLGGNDPELVIPEKVLSVARHLRYFVVENLRSARRYLRLIDKQFPINDSVFAELNEHTPESDISSFLEPVQNGSDMGVLSEAGLPGIADPGTGLILLAHKMNIRVVPLSGPSSMLLALISSGLSGQNFSFNGYLPVNPADRALSIRQLEKRSRDGYSQIFMETPYRNQKLLETILDTCNERTLLCIALNITLPGESIRTRTIADWRRIRPSVHDQLAIFILQNRE
jgi:16S rRNA (cytidine1402-2'-O)-methyltransferase